MPIYSWTPEFIVNNRGGFPGDLLEIHDNRFIGHAGDLLSMLIRLDVVFHDSPINISNAIIEYRLTELVVRPVPGNYEEVIADINRAIDHIELFRMKPGCMTADQGLVGYLVDYKDNVALSKVRRELQQWRKHLTMSVIFEECPQRLRTSYRMGDIREAMQALQQFLSEYRANEAVKKYPWTDSMAAELTEVRKEHANYVEETMSHFPADLLLPADMQNVTPEPARKQECLIDLSAMGFTQEELTGLAEKAAEFGADYTVHQKGLVLNYIPYCDEFEQGVFDE